MRKRIVFGAVMIAAVVGLLYGDWAAGHAHPALAGLPLAAVLVLLVSVAFREVARLAAAAEVQVLPVSGLAGAMAIGTLPWWLRLLEWLGQGPADGEAFLALAGLAMMLIFAEQMLRGRTQDALRRVACTLLAVAYLGAGGALMLLLRLRYGVPALVLFLAAVKFTDIGAYFTGSAIGRHKMIPWLSPGKSWEGLAGGLAAAAGVSLLVAWALPVASLSLGRAAAFGAVVGLAGQFGDLCESLLKRSCRVKDSGALVPEFGGLLDILDSPLLAAPVAYLLLGAML